MSLRETIHNMGSESRASDLIGRAESVLKDCLLNMAKLRLAEQPAELTYCRTQAQAIMADIFKSLGYLNQIYYKRMWGHYREQVRSLPLKPELLDPCLDTIMYSHNPDEIISTCERLIADMLALVAERQKSLGGTRSYKQRMKGYYEEERGMLNKLLTACENRHYETAFFVAIGVQDGLARMLHAAEEGRWPGVTDLGEHRETYIRCGYPDLVALLDPTDFEPLRSAVLQLMEKLEEHLSIEGVTINRFDTVVDFEQFYIQRHGTAIADPANGSG